MSDYNEVIKSIFGRFLGSRWGSKNGPKRAIFRDFGGFGQNYDRAHIGRFLQKMPFLGFDGWGSVRIGKKG